MMAGGGVPGANIKVKGYTIQNLTASKVEASIKNACGGIVANNTAVLLLLKLRLL